MDQFMGEVGSGHAFGRGRHNASTDEAKGRYRDALESSGHTRKQVPAGFTKHRGPNLDRGLAYDAEGRLGVNSRPSAQTTVASAAEGKAAETTLKRTR
jgi:hypothetical protein